MSDTEILRTYYNAYHEPRYRYLLDLIAGYIDKETPRVLDIGRSRLTDLIHESYHVPVDSLGFGSDSQSNTGNHFEFDLNHAQERGKWRQGIPIYRLVIMAEVIEHLHTAPEHVLKFIAGLLQEDGVLILQTPNAVSLSRRFKMLMGRNPYEMIREDDSNPGHFREYTLDELTGIAKTTGYRVEQYSFRYYFDGRFARHKNPGDEPQAVIGGMKNLAGRLLPPRLRSGITVVLRKKTCCRIEN